MKSIPRNALRYAFLPAALVLLFVAVRRDWTWPEAEVALILLGSTLAANIFTIDYPDSERISCAYIFGLVGVFTLGPLESAAIAAVGSALAGLIRQDRWLIATVFAPASAIAVACAGASTAALLGDPFGAISLAAFAGAAVFALIYTSILLALAVLDRRLSRSAARYPTADFVTNLLLIGVPVGLLAAKSYAGEGGLLLASLGVTTLLVVVQSSVNTGTANSRLRRVQSELEDQRAKLQDSLELNREFAQVISHDLRGPLTSVMGHAEMLGRALSPGTVGDNAREHNRRILYNGRRMARLIDNFVALNDLDQQTVLRLVEVDPGQILSQAIEDLREMAVERGIELTLGVDRPGQTIVISEWVLRRVADNLISNALKYTPENGHVAVTLASREGQVILEVADDGIGISKEDQHKLFMPFFRSDSAHVRSMPGTGLGLTLTRRIVLRLGGSIDVASAPGSGSRFTVRLPSMEAITPDAQRIYRDTVYSEDVDDVEAAAESSREA